MASDNTPIKGLIETSFIDWPGFMAAVLFTGGCNFRCPFCHNRDLVLNSSEPSHDALPLGSAKAQSPPGLGRQGRRDGRRTDDAQGAAPNDRVSSKRRASA